MSSDLLSKMVTGDVLTQADKEKLFGLGDQMYGELVKGIETGTNAQKSFWSFLFGEENEAGYLLFLSIKMHLLD